MQREEGRQRVRDTLGVFILEKTACVSHHPVNADKVFGFLGPSRELHVAHRDAIVTHSELILITVDEHLGQVVELRDQLLMGTTEKTVFI